MNKAETDKSDRRALVAQVRDGLMAMEKQFASALPAHIPPARFIRTAMTAVQTNPGLLEANRSSLFAACARAAQDGLILDGREAALVVYRTKGGMSVAQYQPMVHGLLKKVRNSGELASISAHVIYSKDKYRITLGAEERVEHEPCLGDDRGKPVGVYAMARLKDGSTMAEVMTVKDVEKVRAISRAKDAGPWVSWWDEMARKSVLRRLTKRLPSSSDLDQLLEHDNETFDLDAGEVVVDASVATEQTENAQQPKETKAAKAIKSRTRNNRGDALPTPSEEEAVTEETDGVEESDSDDDLV